MAQLSSLSPKNIKILLTPTKILVGQRLESPCYVSGKPRPFSGSTFMTKKY